MERQKTAVGGISVGSSSILVIFVVLALTAFAALSTTTATSDLRLTQRVARATQEYYVADAKAVEAAAELRRVYEVTRREEFPAKAQEAGWTINGMFANLSVPMDDSRTLEITADFSKLPIHFTRWQVVNSADWQEQDSFALWDGEGLGLAASPTEILEGQQMPPIPGLMNQTEAGSVGIIGGADGPTAIFVAGNDSAAASPTRKGMKLFWMQ